MENITNNEMVFVLSIFKEFSLPQLYGVMEIHNKNNILVSAPTGGTKTLTAFLIKIIFFCSILLFFPLVIHSSF